MNTNPSHWIDFLASQSLHLTVLFVVIGLLTLLVRKQSAHLRYLLWLVVLVKCLVPPLWTIPMAILPQQAEPAVVTPQPLAMSEVPQDFSVATSPLSVPTASVPMPEVDVNPPVTQEVVAESVLPSSSTTWFERIDREQGVLVLWLAGGLVFLLITLYRVLRFGRWIRRMRQPLNQSLLGDIESLGSGFDPPLRVQVYTLDGISQPFVWGLWRGSIYVPANFEQTGSTNKRTSVLLHEMAHVRRMDPLVNLIQILVQAVYWFHPLVWITNRFIRAEREKCCDEIAIAKLNTTPKDYGSAIVETLVQEYQARHAVPTLAVAGPVKNLEDRIKTIMKPGKRFYTRPSFKALLVTLLLAVIAVPTTVAFTQRNANSEDDVSVKEPVRELTPGEVFAEAETLWPSWGDIVDDNEPLKGNQVHLAGHIEAGGTREGVVTAQHGDAVYGNAMQYNPELYRGRLRQGDRIELLDDRVFKNSLNRHVIKINTLTASPTIPEGTTGFIDLVSTSFADQFVVSSPSTSKAAAASSVDEASNAPEQINPRQKLYSLFMASGMLCQSIQEAVKADDFETALALCEQVNQHVQEGLPLADQVVEGALFKALATQFDLWKQAIERRDKDTALRLGEMLNQMGGNIAPQVEKMVEGGGNSTAPSEMESSDVISDKDREELERLMQVLFQVSFGSQWQRAEEIIDFENEQQKQRYLSLAALQAEKVDDSAVSDGRTVRVVRIEPVADGRVMVSALFPQQGYYMPMSTMWKRTDKGWRDDIDVEEHLNTLEMFLTLPPEEMNKRSNQQYLAQWQNATGTVLQKRYDENRIKLQHRIQMIQYAQRENLPGAEQMDEARWKRDFNGLKAKTPQEYRDEMIRLYQRLSGPAEQFGKLEFRIVPASIESSQEVGLDADEEQRYREFLRDNGPTAQPAGDDYIWIPLKPETNAYGLITEPYKGQTYILASNQSRQVMLPDGTWSLAAVFPSEDFMGRNSVGIELNEAGGERMRVISQNHIGQHLAIAIDGQVLSVPQINSQISKHAIITGNFTEREVGDMAVALQKGMGVFGSVPQKKEVQKPQIKIETHLMLVPDEEATWQALERAGLPLSRIATSVMRGSIDSEEVQRNLTLGFDTMDANALSEVNALQPTVSEPLDDELLKALMVFSQNNSESCVISAPAVTVLDRESAQISMGSGLQFDPPATSEPVFIGVKIDVKPHLSPRGHDVYLEINANISNIIGFEEKEGNPRPLIEVSEMQVGASVPLGRTYLALGPRFYSHGSDRVGKTCKATSSHQA